MRQHLLMIEDDARLAAMVGDYLEQNGYVVSRAGSGHSGMEALVNATPSIDLVVLDLMLPDIDGLAYCTVKDRGSDAHGQRGSHGSHYRLGTRCRRLSAQAL